MLRHVVLLKFLDDVPAAEIDAIAVALRELPRVVDSIRDYTVGRDLGISDGTSDLVVIGGFDDMDGYAHYRDHPSHQAVVTERVLPKLASRSAAQFEY